MLSKRIAASSTVFVSTQTWSNEEACACTPYLLTLQYVGFNPTILHMKAGCLTDQPVSVPSAAMQRSAATATAEPPEVPHVILLFQ